MATRKKSGRSSKKAKRKASASAKAFMTDPPNLLWAWFHNCGRKASAGIAVDRGELAERLAAGVALLPEPLRAEVEAFRAQLSPSTTEAAVLLICARIGEALVSNPVPPKRPVGVVAVRRLR